MIGIPVEIRDEEFVGKVAEVKLVPSTFGGEQVQVVCDPSDPKATNQRLFWFKPSAKGTSKWMKFVKSFSEARTKAVPGLAPVKDSDEMINSYLCIGERAMSGDIQGVHRDWKEQYVIEYFTSENLALEYFKKANPAAEAAPAEETVEPAPVQIPEPVVAVLKAQWADMLKGTVTVDGVERQPTPEDFWTNVQAWGYTKEAVLAVIA